MVLGHYVSKAFLLLRNGSLPPYFNMNLRTKLSYSKPDHCSIEPSIAHLTCWETELFLISPKILLTRGLKLIPCI